MKINPVVNFNYHNKNTAFKAKIPGEKYCIYEKNEAASNKYPFSHAALNAPVIPKECSYTFLLAENIHAGTNSSTRTIDLLNAPQLERVKDCYKHNSMFKKEFLDGLNKQLQHDETALPYWITDLDSFIAVNNMFSGGDKKLQESFYLGLADTRILNAMPEFVFKMLSSGVSQMESPALASIIYRNADISKPHVIQALNNDFDNKTVLKVLLEMPKRNQPLNMDSYELLNTTLRKLAAKDEEISLEDSYELLQKYADNGYLDNESEQLLNYIKEELNT